jgi:hypothetical protein
MADPGRPAGPRASRAAPVLHLGLHLRLHLVCDLTLHSDLHPGARETSKWRVERQRKD